MPRVPHLLGELLLAGRGEDAAVVSGGRTATYGGLRRDVDRLAGRLRELGLAPGERVLVALPNGIAFPTALLAVWRAGAVAVPVDARIPAPLALRIAADCGARGAILAGPTFLDVAAQLGPEPGLAFALVDRLRAPHRAVDFPVLELDQVLANPAPPVAVGVAPRSEPEDAALIAYTSGSTGRPKGVVHSHTSLLASLEFTRRHEELRRKNRVLVAVPLHHLFALRVLLAHLLTGAAVIAERDLFAGLRRIDPSRPDSMILVPAAAQILLERFGPLLDRLAPRLERIAIGSAPIAPDALAGLRAALPRTRILIPYGMTEARIGFLEPVEGRPERRIAAVDPELELSVVDERGAPVEQGVGEILLRGRALMTGYVHDGEEDRRVRRERGFRTRDLAEVAPDGGLFLLGRVDDVISVGGEKVFPLEVEDVLRTHGSVRDALVTGGLDPRGLLGQVVRAAVVLAPGCALDPDALREHCAAHLEPYKVPARIEALPEIPRNRLGKVLSMERAEPPDGGARG